MAHLLDIGILRRLVNTQDARHVEVRQAVAGRFHYRCHACAVITNARFTRLRTRACRKHGCMLISEEQIPVFVRGEVSALTLPATEPL